MIDPDHPDAQLLTTTVGLNQQASEEQPEQRQQQNSSKTSCLVFPLRQSLASNSLIGNI